MSSTFDEKILSIVNSMSASIPTNPFKNKWISIFGDGMSTYEGWNILVDEFKYPHETVNDVSKTWWHQLLTKLEAKLCVNCSVLAQAATDYYKDDEHWILNKLHREGGTEYVNLDGTHETATNRQDPDIILVSIGTDDFANNKTLGEFKHPSLEEEMTFSYGYNKMIFTLQKNYPNTKIYCLTPIPFGKPYGGFGPNNKENYFWEFVYEVEKIARVYSLPCIHVDKAGFNHVVSENYIDEDGNLKANAMEMIANKCYKEIMNL